MGIAIGVGHIDALVDGGDVGCAGEGPHDAAGTENRQPAKDAQARVHGLERQLLAALYVDRDFEAAAVGAVVGQLLQVLTDHAPRYRVDRRLAHGEHQPGAGDGTDTYACDKAYARFFLQAHLAVEQRAMGDIGVVAGILECAGFGARALAAAELQAHLHHLALGQGDAHGVSAHTGEQQARCRQAGGSGAAASGQAAAQWRRLFAGFFTHRGASPRRAM